MLRWMGTGADWVLVDLRSLNGTWVSGWKVGPAVHHLRDGHEVRFGVQTRQYQFLYRFRVQPPGGPPGPRRAPPPRHVSPPSSSSSSSSSLSSTRSFTSSVAAQSSSSSHSRKRKSGSGSGSESSPPSSSSEQQPPPTKRGRRVSTPASTLPTGEPPPRHHPVPVPHTPLQASALARPAVVLFPQPPPPSAVTATPARILESEPSVPSNPCAKSTKKKTKRSQSSSSSKKKRAAKSNTTKKAARRTPRIDLTDTVAEMDCTGDGEQEDKDEKKDKKDNQRPSKQLKKSPRDRKATTPPQQHKVLATALTSLPASRHVASSYHSTSYATRSSRWRRSTDSPTCSCRCTSSTLSRVESRCHSCCPR